MALQEMEQLLYLDEDCRSCRDVASGVGSGENGGFVSGII